MDDYRLDIVYPSYTIEKKNKIFYSLFNFETKDISYVKVNDDINENILKYLNMIKTPFNDYGLLYNVPVKLKWILIENNIDINCFKNLYLKFLNLYFCETDFDLKEHYIKMDNNDVDKILISDRVKSILYNK